ncbi:hypothetical protein LTR08_004034 [Meristemomyces frigidus]|nr:hypothetical protein LTR08_004034 [Meristemomyces frigidus]
MPPPTTANVGTDPSRLRRPTTVNGHAFWYTSLAKWHAWLAEARSTSIQERKVASHNLRRNDAVGRIMQVTGVNASEGEYATVQRVVKLEEQLAQAVTLLRRCARRQGLPMFDNDEGDKDEDEVKVEVGDKAGDEDDPDTGDQEQDATHRAFHRDAEADLGSNINNDGDELFVEEEPMTLDKRLEDGVDTHQLTTFCFDAKTERFELRTIRRSLGISDVLIQTTHSGICYTDVHAKGKGCGLGHEGVGIVRDVGQAVTGLKVGDRVGWGWLHSSCGSCTTCLTGYRQYCASASGFAFSDLDQGAFSDSRIISAAFAYLIPASISSVDAGPFMCAGASVYEALDAAGTKPEDRVGVVGIGGLGHMAVLFAKAMGCAVTALSSSTGKIDDVFKLGADDVRLLEDMETCHQRDIEGRHHSHADPKPMNINVLLVTSNEVPHLERLMPLLARRATIVLMTIQEQALNIPYMSFVLPGHRLLASTEASRDNHVKMLQFAARHRIKPWIEEYPMTVEGLAKAFDKLEKGEMRYRGVLVRQGHEGSRSSTLGLQPLATSDTG